MIKKHFIPYKELIIKCINSSSTNEHLHVCADLFNRFTEQFKLVVTYDELAEACNEIDINYRQMAHQLSN